VQNIQYTALDLGKQSNAMSAPVILSLEQQLALRQLKVDIIARRIHNGLRLKDKNFYGIFLGDTGSGKSGCAITLCYIMDIDSVGNRRFKIWCDSKGNPSKDTRVVFRMDDFLRFSSSPAGSLPKGSFCVWDETGVEGDNTQWFSLKSRITKYVMQTNRYLNRGCFLTVPDMESIAVGSRRLLQWVFEMQERGDDFAICTPKIIYRDRVQHKTYYYNPKDSENGMLKRIVAYKIPRPPAYLEEPYKKIKEKMTQVWYNEFDLQMQKMKEFVQERKIGRLDDIDEKFEMADRKGSEVDEIEVRNYVLANIDVFTEGSKVKDKVSPDILRMKYLDKKIDLSPSKCKSICNMINFELARKVA
jgi:hypothetical protein